MTGLPDEPAHRATAPFPIEAAKAEAELWAQTQFRNAARDFGYRNLLLTGSSISPLIPAIAAGVLFGLHKLAAGDAVTIALALVSIAAALLGLVLAGLAVVAAFFDPEYVRTLSQRGSLRGALFLFWWVALVAICSVTSSVVLLVTAQATSSRGALAATSAVAAYFFFFTLFETFALVGNVLRHGVYRAEIVRRRAQRNT